MINFRSIVSGSSGNCSIFSDGETNILIDCGISGKKITAFLNEIEVDPYEINGILVTHEHIDHTSGVGVFSRKYDIPVIASKGTWDGMKIGKIEDKNKIAFNKNEPMCIGGICVTPFDIPHDANQPTGFLIEKNGKKYAVATDMGYITDKVIDTLSGCAAVIIEANYDEQMLKNGSYPAVLKKRISGKSGHLDNRDTGVLASKLVKLGTKRIMLGHLSNENNSPEIAFAEVAKELEFNGIYVGQDVQLSIAPRYEKSENLCINL